MLAEPRTWRAYQPPRLSSTVLLGEPFHTIGEVPTEDDAERPQISDHICRQVAGQHRQKKRPGHGGEEHIVLQELAPALLGDGGELGLGIGFGLPTLHDFFYLYVVQGHTPLEQCGENRGVDGLTQSHLRPGLALVDAEEAIPDVAVPTDD